MLKVIRESAIERPWFYRTLMFLIAAVFVVTMGWWGFEENKEDSIVRVGTTRCRAPSTSRPTSGWPNGIAI